MLVNNNLLFYENSSSYHRKKERFGYEAHFFIFNFQFIVRAIKTTHLKDFHLHLRCHRQKHIPKKFFLLKMQRKKNLIAGNNKMSNHFPKFFFIESRGRHECRAKIAGVG